MITTIMLASTLMGGYELPVTAINDVQNSPIIEYRLSPEKLHKAGQLYHAWIRLYIANAVFNILLLLIILKFRLGVTFRNWVEQASPNKLVQVFSFTPLLLGTIGIFNLPLQAFRHHLMSHYELSLQSWSSWLLDYIKLGIAVITIGILFVGLFYVFVRISPKRWWFYGWLISAIIIFFLVLIKPVFLDPLFNKFDSLALTQPQLFAEVTKLTHRGNVDIDSSQMFVMQASDKTTLYNAYVAGFGSDKRLVIWDTILKDMTTHEIMAVFAHEQGHYVLHHLWISTAIAILSLLAVLYMVHKSVGLVLIRYGRKLSVRSIDDWASLPLVLLMLCLLALLCQPIISTFSRYHEHQADIYGLEAIHGLVPNSPQVAASALQKLGEKNLEFPKPNSLWVFWVYNHPSIAERISFATQYQPWKNNQQMKYIH